VERVHADPDADNTPSLALAERLGMTLEGETRDGRGRRYGVLAQEWRSRRDG
jgi:RimJ/RimL family protein N-acetyltransferase